MEATKYNFFKPNTRQAVFGFFSYILPVGLTMYFVKTQRVRNCLILSTSICTVKHWCKTSKFSCFNAFSHRCQMCIQAFKTLTPTFT